MVSFGNVKLLALHVMGHLIFHDFVGVFYLEFRRYKKTEEILVGQVIVATPWVRGFEHSHPFEEPQEVRTSIVRRINLLVAEFTDEARISMVHPDREQTEIGEFEVSVVTVNVVRLEVLWSQAEPSSGYNRMHDEGSTAFIHMWVARMIVLMANEVFPIGDFFLDPKAVGSFVIDLLVLRAPEFAQRVKGDECSIR